MKKVLLSLLFFGAFLAAKAQDYASIDFSDKVVRSFSQGDNSEFNSAAISLIKCAIATFGTADVLKRIEITPNEYLVTLRNNEVVRLSQAELAYVKYKCGFKLTGEESIFDKSILLYAVMAKRTVNNANPLFSACKDLPGALSFLHAKSQNLNVINLVPLLGFNYIEVRPFSEICYIHQNGRQAAFACYQNFDDDGIKRGLDAVHWSKHTGLKPKKTAERLNIILANFIPDIASVSFK